MLHVGVPYIWNLLSTASYTNVSTGQKLVKKCLHSDRSGS